MKLVAVFLCDVTGIAAQPWIENGYDAVLIDPQHPKGVTVNGPITRIGHVIDHPVTWKCLSALIRQGRVSFVAGFPPCTDLAVSGARWFEHKGKKDWAFQFKAMHVVWQCQVIAELAGCPWMVENPVSVIASLWRKCDHSFSPCDYTAWCPDDNYNKKTMLWVGGGFEMPPFCRDMTLGPPDDRIHRAAPSEERANFRSATPRGFARAVFHYNCGL